ncbi:MAG: hypothetical protein ACJA08_000063 [Cyclobacteriaceae bacterium]|jgi:hypothetical protein
MIDITFNDSFEPVLEDIAFARNYFIQKSQYAKTLQQCWWFLAD